MMSVLSDRLQQDVGDPRNYSNNDLCNVINIGQDARTVIISKYKECEEAEAYSPSSNYRVFNDHQRQARKRANIRAHDSEASPSRPTPLPQ